jgi:RHS repeat-associated protein
VGPDLTIKKVGATTQGTVHVSPLGVRVVSITGTARLFYYRDCLGSVVATSLPGGVQSAGYRYSPYGPIFKSGETTANASGLGYTGALQLSEGLIYLNARVYNPQMRRFLQADGVDSVRYSYVRGDPVGFTDPTGRQRDPSGGKPTVSAGTAADAVYGPAGARGGDFVDAAGDPLPDPPRWNPTADPTSAGGANSDCAGRCYGTDLVDKFFTSDMRYAQWSELPTFLQVVLGVVSFVSKLSLFGLPAIAALIVNDARRRFRYDGLVTARSRHLRPDFVTKTCPCSDRFLARQAPPPSPGRSSCGRRRTRSRNGRRSSG